MTSLAQGYSATETSTHTILAVLTPRPLPPFREVLKLWRWDSHGKLPARVLCVYVCTQVCTPMCKDTKARSYQASCSITPCLMF